MQSNSNSIDSYEEQQIRNNRFEYSIDKTEERREIFEISPT